MSIINSLCHKEVALASLHEKERADLIKKLVEFTQQYYRIDDPQCFIERVLQPDTNGTLVIYSIADTWVGYTCSYQQTLMTSKKQYTVFSSSVWYNPNLQLDAATARFALLHTLRYRLFKPHESLAYFVIASSPQRYNYLKKLNPDCESCPNGTARMEITELITAMAQQNNWEQDIDNPFIIHQKFPALTHLQHSTDTASDFIKLNPKYNEGDWLMVYVPLDLQTISKSIKLSVREAVT